MHQLMSQFAGFSVLKNTKQKKKKKTFLILALFGHDGHCKTIANAVISL